MTEHAPAQRPTVLQRLVRQRLHSLAGKAPDEPLGPEDWSAFYRHHTSARGAAKVLSALPHGPRRRICGAPFAGVASRALGPLGYRPSRKNLSRCCSRRRSLTSCTSTPVAAGNVAVSGEPEEMTAKGGPP